MKEAQSRFSPAYRGTLVIALSQQTLLGILCGLFLDGGMIGIVFFLSCAVFWIGFLTILARHPKNPTKTDIFLIKWGNFLLFMMCVLMLLMLSTIKGEI